ncbi:hypothetical protein H6G54_18800 [Anabaena cylindrica FACHB-243]|uniref:Uncharacterized protein n=1 Tax=Anabaena cylindrica (strain ATCC 27899 / PCC 7122) TaxID=272123 RepID=K9ZFF6_ANACC|nr:MULTISPECIES: hypothetical protein [Anabaena]AFZ57926.1 hypothetical protein Anacy_2478 [Anabaena cylindrica PCC 7122]MBD2419718.1 hypothetical protein [Anabaena cylindrica FACHB-243]MCM2409239.1 hypothetical protein [Anabaena sp. CCAP 1446/1C]BAY05112.1 hypothetical protein NIES19_43810 [Anabaena cylindrica PCC 7122]
MDISPNFQPGQIVRLNYSDRNLYAEVVQVIISRNLCWVRPLLLANFSHETPLITDLRDASDLLWPIKLFQAAMDTEVIGLLSQLLPKEAKADVNTVAQQQLNHFIYQLWQASHNDKEL